MVQYLTNVTRGRKVGVVMGLRNLKTVFDDSFYTNLKGGILEAFGLGFGSKVKLMVYPEYDHLNGVLSLGKDLEVTNSVRGLLQYLKDNDKIVDIENAKKEIMHIFSDDVLHMIKTGKTGWEKMVPVSVAEAIKSKQLFNYRPSEVMV